MAWGEDKPVFIGMDQGSPDGDKTIVSLHDGEKHIVIGESVTLTIPLKGKWDKTVKAIQIGDLAVHESLEAIDGYKWQVTHVPTLTMFDRAIPDGDWTQEQLLKWCWKVQQDYRSDWEVLALYNNSNYSQIPFKAREVICVHCVSVAIE